MCKCAPTPLEKIEQYAIGKEKQKNAYTRICILQKLGNISPQISKKTFGR